MIIGVKGPATLSRSKIDRIKMEDLILLLTEFEHSDLIFAKVIG